MPLGTFITFAKSIDTLTVSFEVFRQSRWGPFGTFIWQGRGKTFRSVKRREAESRQVTNGLLLWSK